MKTIKGILGFVGNNRAVFGGMLSNVWYALVGQIANRIISPYPTLFMLLAAVLTQISYAQAICLRGGIHSCFYLL